MYSATPQCTAAPGCRSQAFKCVRWTKPVVLSNGFRYTEGHVHGCLPHADELRKAGATVRPLDECEFGTASRYAMMVTIDLEGGAT